MSCVSEDRECRLLFQEFWLGKEEQKRKSKLRSGAVQEGVDRGFQARSAPSMFIGVRAGPALCSLRMPMGCGEN